MRTFVYGSRVIENEQQIRLERRVKKLGSWIRTLAKSFAAFLFFVVLNALLNHLAQHTNDLFTVNTYRLIQESARVLLIDNAFSTSSFVTHVVLNIVSALTFVCVVRYALVVQALGNSDEHKEKEQDSHNKCEERPQTVNGYSIVSYKQKVCFLS